MSNYPVSGGATPGKARREAMRKKLTEAAAKGERVVLEEHKKPWKPSKLQTIVITTIVCMLSLYLVSFAYQHTGDRVIVDNGHEQVITLLETYEGPEQVEFSMFVDVMMANGITKGELEDIEYYHQNYEAPQ